MKNTMLFCFPQLKKVMLLALGFALTACQPDPADTSKDYAEALRKKGYASAPIVTAVSQSGPGTVIVTGTALPDGRVRFLYGQRAIGVTADAKGRFNAELPAAPQGSVYDLSMEDAGRLMHAEGRLFVPPGQPAKAVLLRPGTPSLPVSAQGLGIAVVDFDSAGAISVTGRAGPNASLNVIVNEEVRAQPVADANGQFTAMTQVPPPGDSQEAVHLAVQAGDTSWRREIMVSKAAGNGDHVTPIPEGWRVDWKLPGGGMQTTLVF